MMDSENPRDWTDAELVEAVEEDCDNLSFFEADVHESCTRRVKRGTALSAKQRAVLVRVYVDRAIR
jgi:hypothetical protein